MKKLIYVAEFDAKKEVPFKIKKGRCYVAPMVGNNYEVGDGTGSFLLPPGVTGNDLFYAEIIEVTPENVETIKIHPKDKVLVGSFFRINEEVEKAASRYNEDVDVSGEIFLANMDKIVQTDPIQLGALFTLVSHMAKTCDDKYNESTPMVDVTWLKYGPGKIPAGYNVGQAAGYLKRYLSEGYEKSYNPEDLLKAIHFLLFEVTRRNDEQGA